MADSFGTQSGILAILKNSEHLRRGPASPTEGPHPGNRRGTTGCVML